MQFQEKWTIFRFSGCTNRDSAGSMPVSLSLHPRQARGTNSIWHRFSPCLVCILGERPDAHAELGSARGARASAGSFLGSLAPPARSAARHDHLFFSHEYLFLKDPRASNLNVHRRTIISILLSIYFPCGSAENILNFRASKN